MTWDDVRDWTWHLLHDPIRDNWWSLGLLTGLATLGIIAVMTLWIGIWRNGRRAVWRRNRKDQPVSEPTEQTEGNGPNSYSYLETPQQQRERRDRTAHRRPTMGDGPADPEPIRDVSTVVQGIDYTDGPGLQGRPVTLADAPVLASSSDGSRWSVPVTDVRSGNGDEGQSPSHDEVVMGDGDMDAYRARQDAGIAAAVSRGSVTYEVGPNDSGVRGLVPPDPGGEVRYGLPDPRPGDSGVHAMPIIQAERQTCPACKGTGYMPSQNDLLRESIALVGDGGDMVVKEFYTRLLQAAPDLASLFPPDLLIDAKTPDWEGYSDEGKREMLVRAGLIGENDPLPADPPVRDGRKQRDRLLGALVALSQSYDRTDFAAMNRLDIALASFGRHHAAFARPDGTVSGATLEEYAAVKAVLFATLIDAAGEAWKPEYTAAWSDAYDYAAGVMMAEQRRTEMLVPRMPRA